MAVMNDIYFVTAYFPNIINTRLYLFTCKYIFANNNYILVK